MSTDLLHVCNGHATSNLLRAAGVPGRFTHFVDVLGEGPCPPLWGKAWRDLRLAFLTDGYATEPAPADLSWDDEIAAALGEGGEIVLWYEHDLFDQLLLVRLLALIARHEGPRARISLVSIDAHPSVPRLKGLGELAPEAIGALFPTRAPVTPEMIALGRDAWAAYSDPDPRAVEALLARDLSALPFLARALRRHLEEYPGLGDGLSRSERQLLGLVQAGVADPLAVWLKLHALEDCHYLADTQLVRLIERLAAPPAPALVSDGEIRVPIHKGAAALALTPLGREILAGARDWGTRARRRWLGGVDLATADWRWDAASGRLARPA